MKKLEHKKYEFKGWDYEELGDCWKLFKKFNADIDTDKIIIDYLRNEGDKKKKIIARDIRLFLTRVLSQGINVGYWAPVWRGLLEIKDDYTLIQVTIPLLPYMWT